MVRPSHPHCAFQERLDRYVGMLHTVFRPHPGMDPKDGGPRRRQGRKWTDHVPLEQLLVE